MVPGIPWDAHWEPLEEALGAPASRSLEKEGQARFLHGLQIHFLSWFWHVLTHHW